MGERLLCKQEVVGSIPSGSTNPIVRYRPFGLLERAKWNAPSAAALK